MVGGGVHCPGLIQHLLSPSWSSQFCRVVKDTGNYVECACSHLSVYAASAEFAALASYNAAFYASGIICASGIREAPPLSLVSPRVQVGFFL